MWMQALRRKCIINGNKKARDRKKKNKWKDIKGLDGKVYIKF